MSEYLVLAENITFKNNRLTCINIYDRLSAIALPAEFKFDLAIMCGPNWSEGEHNLTIKAVGNNGVEVSIGTLNVNIPNGNFVYNAFANDIKIIMDYSVSELTFKVYDSDNEIISRTYPVVPMLVPQKKAETPNEQEENKESENQENQENQENN